MTLAIAATRSGSTPAYGFDKRVIGSLRDAELYRALIARDPRFDGVFFVGVTSTRVYCRPICRAPKPRDDRCRYFQTQGAAAPANR